MGGGPSQNVLYYLAYGSNLHPVRLRERVGSARFIDVVQLSHYQLLFQKRGMDVSGKCTLVHTGREADVVYGAVYQIDPAHKPELDAFEGLGNGYFESRLTVTLSRQEYPCFTYVAQPSYIVNNLKPYHWYKHLVVLGAKHCNFPEAYVRSIEVIESVEDSDEARREQHQRLIEEIINYENE